MKELYEGMELEVIRFRGEDVITASAEEEAACADDAAACTEDGATGTCTQDSTAQDGGCPNDVTTSCPDYATMK